MPKKILIIKELIEKESKSAYLLLFVTVLALISANSAFSALYHNLFHHAYHFNIGTLNLKFSLHYAINDGLMSVFFFLVGLEIKRELVKGELSKPQTLIVPLLAASGGVIIPALIYVSLNWQYPHTLKGWAIPCATDIAFALGILSLFGKRVPQLVKVLLTAVAIIDDLIAVTIIALFYTQTINFNAVLLSSICLGILALLNYRGVQKTSPYLLIGIVLWFLIFLSGIHATVAGVLLAFTIPCRSSYPREESLLIKLERRIHSWVAFIIVPLFAFANAGISFGQDTFSNFWSPISLGVIAGLVIGKPLGIFGAFWLLKVLKALPAAYQSQMHSLFGMSAFAGIGFTMSLFIGGLAFNDPAMLEHVKLGVLIGSIFAALIGSIIFMVKKDDPPTELSSTI